MATSKKFSELPAAASVGNGDLFAIAHEDAQAETGYVSQKLTAAQAGQKVNGDTEYPTSLPSFPENGQNPFAALEKLNQDIIDLYPVSTASGAIANFTTSLAKPLTELTSTIVAQQASGTPTPSTPLPISGVSSVKFRHTKKSTVVANVVGEYASENGVITQTTAAFPYPYKCVIARVEQGETYTYSVNGVATTIPVLAFFTSYPDIGMVSYNNGRTVRGDATFIAPIDGFIFIRGNADFDEVNQMVSKGSTVTAYEDGNTFTIQLGETVYGGVIDAKNGKLVITHDFKIFDGSSDENWFISSTNAYYGIEIGVNSMVADTVISNLFESIQGAPSSDHLGINNSPRYVRVRPSADAMDLQAFKTWLSNNNLQVCYELATPIEITGLTPANFTTIAGEQNIFSDCGDVTVGFKQGIQEYIDAQIAATQALIL